MPIIQPIEKFVVPEVEGDIDVAGVDAVAVALTAEAVVTLSDKLSLGLG